MHIYLLSTCIIFYENFFIKKKFPNSLHKNSTKIDILFYQMNYTTQ